MKTLETKIKKWLRPGPHQWVLRRLRRETTAVMGSLVSLRSSLSPAKVIPANSIFRHAAHSPAGGGLPHWSDLKFCHKFRVHTVFTCGKAASGERSTVNGQLSVMVVIPVYNHASTVAEIVRKSLKSGLDTLAVDDGSGPETQAALRETGVRVLRLEKNTGKGAAILAGARAAAESGHSHIITIDADMQHDPADIVKFIKKINESPTAIVAGERNLKAAGAPLSSRIGRRLSNSALKLLAGVKIPDTQCGFRAYPARLLESLGCVSRRYDFEMEVLARAARAGVPLETVKISVMYSADTQRNSNFKPFADVLRILKICLRLLLKPGPNSTKTP